MRRTATLLAVVGLAPLIVFAATLGGEQLRRSGEETVAERRVVARETNARIDGVLLTSQSALAELAGSRALAAGDWTEMGRRARETAEKAGWRNLHVTDVDSGRQVWEMRRGRASGPAAPSVVAYLANPANARPVGDIAGGPPDCPCIPIHQPVHENGVLRYILTAEVGHAPFQHMLEAATQAPEVGAIVDRRGHFIARTVEPEKRLGKPASQYVRAAIASGRSGVYEGVTLEGLRNRSVFETSSLSGFSTHLAMPAAWFGLLGAGSLGLTLGASLLALAVAAVGVWLAVREQQRWRRGEQQRLQAQKMEAVGLFASGVAHDFNNLLTVILGNLRRVATPDPAIARRIDHATQAAEKGAALVAQLMAFARDKPLSLEPVDVADTVIGLKPLLETTVGSAVGLKVAATEGVPAARTSKAMLEIALINLASNARDAMPQGGEVTIAVSQVEGMVELVVSDTGHGMSSDVAARALEPFFTSKAAGKGTGLGLAQVHRLVLDSHGAISIESAPGAGTTVRIRLPVSDAVAASEPEPD